MQYIFSSLYQYFSKKPVVFYSVFLVSLAIALNFALRVKFEEDISRILPADEKVEKLTRVFNNSKFADRLVVTVSMKDTTVAGNPDSLVMYAAAMSDAIQKQLGEYIGNLRDKVDDEKTLQLIDAVSEHLPL